MNATSKKPTTEDTALLWLDNCRDYSNGPVRTYWGRCNGFDEALDIVSKKAIGRLFDLYVPGITAETLATLFRDYDDVPLITTPESVADITHPDVWGREVDLCRQVIAAREGAAREEAARKGLEYAPVSADQQAIIRARAQSLHRGECLGSYTFLCKRCRFPAATLVYVRSRSRQDGTDDYIIRIHGFCGVSDAGGNKDLNPGIIEALRAGDARRLYRMNGWFAPFYCPDCKACYCYKDWNAAMRFDDDGGYDETVGTCPRGHRHVIDD